MGFGTESTGLALAATGCATMMMATLRACGSGAEHSGGTAAGAVGGRYLYTNPKEQR
ncbi:hypothetical protein KCP69_11445 [Salmonella enterica subsp. enterica]|nr:hypothetical protein KCP69_11445 [Salmonella enterica subsp. enterica]